MNAKDIPVVALNGTEALYYVGGVPDLDRSPVLGADRINAKQAHALDDVCGVYGRLPSVILFLRAFHVKQTMNRWGLKEPAPAGLGGLR